MSINALEVEEYLVTGQKSFQAGKTCGRGLVCDTANCGFFRVVLSPELTLVQRISWKVPGKQLRKNPRERMFVTNPRKVIR